MSMKKKKKKKEKCLTSQYFFFKIWSQPDVLQSYEIVTHFQNDRFHGIVTHYVRTKFLKRTKFWKKKKKTKKIKKKKKERKEKKKKKKKKQKEKCFEYTPHCYQYYITAQINDKLTPSIFPQRRASVYFC
jgi:hypothetical protein